MCLTEYTIRDGYYLLDIYIKYSPKTFTALRIIHIHIVPNRSTSTCMCLHKSLSLCFPFPLGLKSILTFHTTDLIAKLKQSSNSSDIQNLVRAAMKALQRT